MENSKNYFLYELYSVLLVKWWFYLVNGKDDYFALNFSSSIFIDYHKKNTLLISYQNEQDYEWLKLPILLISEIEK